MQKINVTLRGGKKQVHWRLNVLLTGSAIYAVTVALSFQRACAPWSTSTTASPSVSVSCTVSRWEAPSTAGFTTPAASASGRSAWTTAASWWSAWTACSETRGACWYQMSAPYHRTAGRGKYDCYVLAFLSYLVKCPPTWPSSYPCKFLFCCFFVSLYIF